MSGRPNVQWSLSDSERLTADMLAPVVSADPAKPFVIAQLGQALDGRIATTTGESRWINRDEALNHLHRLRAAVDAVVVGAGTVLADNPALNVRRVAGRNPARVIIDPSGRVVPSVRCLDGSDGAERYVIRSPEAPDAAVGETIRVERSTDGRTLSPLAIVDALFARGMKRLLIEGGAWTISEFINARAVDRLHVLVAPLILGSGKTGLTLPPIERLSDAIRPDTRVFILADGDVLFDCDLRRSWSPS